MLSARGYDSTEYQIKSIKNVVTLLAQVVDDLLDVNDQIRELLIKGDGDE